MRSLKSLHLFLVSSLFIYGVSFCLPFSHVFAYPLPTFEKVTPTSQAKKPAVNKPHNPSLKPTPAFRVTTPPSTTPFMGSAQTLQAEAQQQQPDEYIMIILDASFSMADKLPTGETRMQAAKKVVLDAMSQIPSHVNVGLKVYGISRNSFTACHAAKTLVPMGKNNRHLISSQLIGIQPTGATPISYTLKQSVDQDFYNVPFGSKKRIILVSDGEETCDVDPCSVAIDFVKSGVQVKIDVVGFAVYQPKAINQLKCVAASTYGKFYQADTAASLARSLNESINATTQVQGRVLIPGQP